MGSTVGVANWTFSFTQDCRVRTAPFILRNSIVPARESFKFSCYMHLDTPGRFNILMLYAFGNSIVQFCFRPAPSYPQRCGLHSVLLQARPNCMLLGAVYLSISPDIPNFTDSHEFCVASSSRMYFSTAAVSYIFCACLFSMTLLEKPVPHPITCDHFSQGTLDTVSLTPSLIKYQFSSS